MSVLRFNVDSPSAQMIRDHARAGKCSVSACLRKEALGEDVSKPAKIVRRLHP